MQLALALIYVLMHIVPVETDSFTFNATPAHTFHLTRLQDGQWDARLTDAGGEKPFGRLSADGRTLVVTKAEGVVRVEAANYLQLPEKPDWTRIDRCGARGAEWTILRLPDRIEFTLHIAGQEHPQKVVATLHHR